MKEPPSYVLLENVKNFELSKARDMIVGVLCELDYYVQEFIISPTQIGIPNERIRYYLLAQRMTSPITAIPVPFAKDIHLGFPSGIGTPIDHKLHTLKPYLLSSELVFDDLLVESKMFQRHKGYRFDIVCPQSTVSTCFTKGYGRSKFVRGTGPLLQTITSDTQQEGVLGIEAVDWMKPETLVSQYAPRWLHPLEIAALLGFPVSHTTVSSNTQKFSFPFGSLSYVQCFELLGNSISVTTVSRLMRYLFNNCCISTVPQE